MQSICHTADHRYKACKANLTPPLPYRCRPTVSSLPLIVELHHKPYIQRLCAVLPVLFARRWLFHVSSQTNAIATEHARRSNGATVQLRECTTSCDSHACRTFEMHVRDVHAGFGELVLWFPFPASAMAGCNRPLVDIFRAKIELVSFFETGSKRVWEFHIVESTLNRSDGVLS